MKKEFPRERIKLSKPDKEIGLSDGSKVPNDNSLKHFSKKIDQDPEYKSMYLDNHRTSIKNHSQTRRPSGTSLSNISSTNGNFGYNRRLSRFTDQQASSSSMDIRSRYEPASNKNISAFNLR